MVFGKDLHVHPLDPFAAAMDQQDRGQHPREAEPVKVIEDAHREFRAAAGRIVAHRMHCTDGRMRCIVGQDRAPGQVAVAIDRDQLGDDPVWRRGRTRKEPQVARLAGKPFDPAPHPRLVRRANRSQTDLAPVLKPGVNNDRADRAGHG